MVKSVLGNITLQGFAGGMAPAQSVPNGVVTPPGTPLVQYQVAYPNAAGQLIGSSMFTYNDQWNQSTGISNGLTINPEILQSGTAGYTILDVNPTQTSAGNGLKLLQRWAVANSVQGLITNTGVFNSTMIRATVVAGNNTGNAINTLESLGSFGIGIRTIATSQASLSTDSTMLVNASSGNLTISLPTALGATRSIRTIKKIDASVNTVTIQANGAELIDGTNTRVLSTQWSSLQIQCDGTAWYILTDR